MNKILFAVLTMTAACASADMIVKHGDDTLFTGQGIVVNESECYDPNGAWRSEFPSSELKVFNGDKRIWPAMTAKEVQNSNAIVKQFAGMIWTTVSKYAEFSEPLNWYEVEAFFVAHEGDPNMPNLETDSAKMTKWALFLDKNGGDLFKIWKAE